MGVLHVAVGVVRDSDGRILVAQRGPKAHLPGLWEFPGGKRKPGEQRIDTLRRELNEEVGIEVWAANPLICVAHDYAEGRVELDVWEITAWEGEVRSAEGQAIQWVKEDELCQLDMPPADGPIVQAIQLPSYYLVSPEPSLTQPTAFVDRLIRCLGRGVTLVQLRVKREPKSVRDRARLIWLIRDVVAVSSDAGAKLLLNAPLELERYFADVAGLHLSARRLAQTNERPDVSLVGASCHDAKELERAEQLGVSFAVLGSVKTTESHPGGRILGWEGFESLVRDARLPVFALGGMQLKDLTEARARGGQGIAAIRSLWEPDEYDSVLAGVAQKL